MAAYHRVYDSRHLQADCQERGSVPVIEYELPLPFLQFKQQLSRRQGDHPKGRGGDARCFVEISEESRKNRLKFRRT